MLMFLTVCCSEEIYLPQGSAPARRQGVLEGYDTWEQGVGGRRMLQRYVGEL